MFKENESDHPVIGVIGGMGPMSTLDFQLKLFNEMGKVLKAQRDQDFLRVLVDNNCKIPDRTQALLEGLPSPLPYIQKSVKFLESAGASILAIPCNTAHLYFDEIQKATKTPIVNMIEEVSSTIAKAKKETVKVGLLATNATAQLGLFSRSLEKYGIPITLPDSKLQNEIHNTIYKLKTHTYLRYLDFQSTANYPQNSPFYKKYKSSLPQPLKKAFLYFKNLGVTHVILGCTELSTLPFTEKDTQDITPINPSLILASRVIEIATTLYKK